MLWGKRLVMGDRNGAIYKDIDKCIDDIIRKIGKKIVCALPFALGKPNQFINSLYQRAKNDSDIELKILTALTVEVPSAGDGLQRRLVEPFVKRIFGDFPSFEYMLDLRKGILPPNVFLYEFYTKAGGFLKSDHVQQNYISSNYTHIPRDMINMGLNLSAQLMTKKNIDGKIFYSASSNADTTIELERRLKAKEAQGRKAVVVGQINTNLPFMYGDAVREAEDFDMIIDDPSYDFKLFAPPKVSVMDVDYMIGLNASTMVQDGGTLQIGIGALGDAIVYGLTLRHEHNDLYKSLILDDLKIGEKNEKLLSDYGGVGVFDKGIYGSTEMLVDGFMRLYKSGIVKRKVYDDVKLQKLINEDKIADKITPSSFNALVENGVIAKKLTKDNFNYLKKYGIFKDELKFEDGYIINGSKSIEADFTKEENLLKVTENCLGKNLKGGIVLHGSFFLGPEDFYDALNNMSEDERKIINMTGVEYVNQLYGDEEIKRLQRTNARFINAGMKLTLSGAVVSDAYYDGLVVSGVGGQYNFVTMAHALEDARGILMIKTTRKKNNEVKSNVVFNYGHITIPRHLRDIIVTEYGIADLKGHSDKDVITAILNVTDSRFQENLLKQAKKARKIPENYHIPDRFKNNCPEMITNTLKPYKKEKLFPLFPFGSALTKEELVIAGSLKQLKADMKVNKTSYADMKAAYATIPAKAHPYLERMKLEKISSAEEDNLQKMLIHALFLAGHL